MKIKLSQLKKLIRESVLFEKQEMSKSSTLAVTASTIKSKDNSEAIALKPNEAQRVQAGLGVKNKSSFYYVWTGAKKAGIADAPIYMIGTLTKGNGDPYTYEKVSGVMYRVISGPVSKTIGKTFKFDPAPGVSVEIPQAEPEIGETEVARTASAPVVKSKTPYERRKENIIKVIDKMLSLSDERMKKNMIQAIKSKLVNDKENIVPLDTILNDLANPKVVGLTKDQLANYNISILGLSYK